MKEILYRLLVATALTIAALVVLASVHAQQPDQYPTAATPRLQNPAARPKEVTPPNIRLSSADDQTQDAVSFTGRTLQEKDALILCNPVTMTKYSLDDRLRTKRYLGKRVKARGKLDMKSTAIRVKPIGPLLY